MAKHLVPTKQPAIVHTEMYSGYGLSSPSGLRRVAEGLNFVSGRQKKLVFCRAQNHLSVTGGSSAAIYAWPFYFRTGENTTALDVIVGVAVTPFAAVSPPLLVCSVKPGGGGAAVNGAGEGQVTFDGASGGANIAPSEVSHKRLRITGLAANTEYKVENQLTNGMCLVYMVAVEAGSRHADDSVTAVCSPGKYAAEGPIYDEHAQDLVDANNSLWRHNGAQLLSWSCDYEAGTSGTGVPVITVNTSYTDIYSTTLTIATLYHNTRRRSGSTAVPVKLAVLSDRTGGAGTLSVRLYDGTNSIEVTGIGDDTGLNWSTATGTLPAQLAGYKLQAKQSNGTTTHRIYGLSLFEYEA